MSNLYEDLTEGLKQAINFEVARIWYDRYIAFYNGKTNICDHFFVPCKRDSNNTPGFYDLVDKKFFPISREFNNYDYYYLRNGLVCYDSCLPDYKVIENINGSLPNEYTLDGLDGKEEWKE